MRFTNELIAQIAQFLAEIGIEVHAANLNGETFLPGLHIDAGVIYVDEAHLLYPGDILHEAGHLAVMAPEDRRKTGAHVGEDGGFEMAAIAWSYAAALHIGIDPAVVFHADGYRGGGQNIIENFRNRRYFGVPILQWLGMTLDEATAARTGGAPFPHMVKWLSNGLPSGA